MKIELPEETWNIVLNALAERPFKEVAGIVQEMQTQAQAQILAAAKPKRQSRAKRVPAAS